jgi:hypothetical protein
LTGRLQGRLAEARVRAALRRGDGYRPALAFRDRAFWDGLDDEQRRYWIARGERYLDFPWPAFTPDLYDEYARTGERARFEKAYHKRRQVVTTLVLAEGMENRGRFLPGLRRGLERMAEEPTWVLPAHFADGRGPADHAQDIDIFSAETANMVAWILHLLGAAGGAGGDPLLARLRAEVERRLLAPYLARDDFWWLGHGEGGVGNWTTWCASNCLGAFLLLEGDPGRRAQGVQKACASLDRFLEAYAEDGGCDEGPTYWNFAGGCLFDSLEMLAEATAGALDLFADPVVEGIGTYIGKVHVNDLYFVNFADSPPQVPVDAALMYRYGRRIGDAYLQALGAHLHRVLDGQDPENTIRLKMYRALRTLGDERAMRAWPPPQEAPREAYFPRLQVMVAREEPRPGRGLLVAVKGGHNDEGHNHNDVGNVVVYLDGAPVVVDAGMKQYTRGSFGPARYEIWAMQSGFHNVPVVNDTQQEAGPAFTAREAGFRAEAGEAAFRADIGGAYPAEAGLRSWVRACTLHRARRELVLRDEYVFAGDGNTFELRYLVDRRPHGEGEAIRLGDGVEALLRLETSPRPTAVRVHAFALRDPQLVWAWGETLYQLRLRFERVPRAGACLTTFQVRPWPPGAVVRELAFVSGELA